MQYGQDNGDRGKHLSDIPWPPGKWRLGVSCCMAEYVFLRFALKSEYCQCILLCPTSQFCLLDVWCVCVSVTLPVQMIVWCCFLVVCVSDNIIVAAF